MSPLYVPRKRKSLQSQPKSGAPCPGEAESSERISVQQGAADILCFSTFHSDHDENLLHSFTAVQRMPETSCELNSSGYSKVSASAGMVHLPSSALEDAADETRLSVRLLILNFLHATGSPLHSSVLECFRMTSLKPKML